MTISINWNSIKWSFPKYNNKVIIEFFEAEKICYSKSKIRKKTKKNCTMIQFMNNTIKRNK